MKIENPPDGEGRVPFRKPKKGEEVVVTGMSGSFPDSKNVYDFSDNLFNKVDLVSGDYRRWRPIHPEVPQRTGKIYDVEKFDLGFFGVTSSKSDNMDPMTRIVLEKTFEAIADAGYHPSDLANTNTVVLTGSCFSETEKFVFYENQRSRTEPITGTQRSMVAKWLSYYFKLNGSAFITDTACSSSLFAFEHAYSLIKEGLCDKALVCGTHLCLHPIVSLQFARLGVLSRDGSCKSFDDAGNGYARSEGIVVMLLERAKDAKRIYAEILHAKTNCDGYKKEGITYPSSDLQKVLMKDFYEECKIDPASLTFVEAHGTGTKVGDPEELRTLDEIFCKGRDKPLYIGAVKSNIGHNEPTSGLCSLTKVIIAMETGYIPPNINYNKPREGEEGLEKGRMIIVTEKLPLPDDRGLFGVNSFGFGGANAHVLLHWNPKSKVNGGQPNDDLPRLVCVSGRTVESVRAILDDFQTRGCDAEYVYIIQQVFRKPIENHLHRGYGIYSKQDEVKRSLTKVGVKKRKLYWIFSNFDKEWLKIGHQLMALPIFAKTIKSIHNILIEDVNLNFSEIIKNPVEENFVNQILGTVAIQISLANILKEINLIPHRIVGIGSGELVAAYVDGYLTLKQAVLGLFYLASNLNKNNKNWELLEKIMPTRKNSYEKWIPIHEETLGKNSAKYFANNMTTSTNGRNIRNFLSKESIPLIIGTEVKDISGEGIRLVGQNSKNLVQGLLSNLGNLYEYGFDMHLDKLYPSVELPVSRGTPMLSPLIKWMHRRDCEVHSYKNEAEMKSGHRVLHVIPKTDDWNFVVGHVIDGRNLFPATGYLVLAWESLAIMTGKLFSEMQVVFEDVRYMRAANVPKDGSLELTVMIQMGSQDFEITEGGVTLVTGKVYERTDAQSFVDLQTNMLEDDMILTEKDVYKELKLRGYHYSGKFKNIRKCNVDGSCAIIEWNGNWIGFMDCLLQLILLQEGTRNILVPTSIQHLTINAPMHVHMTSENNMVPVQIHTDLQVIRAGGVELRGMGASSLTRKKPGDPVLETYKFIANNGECNTEDAIRVLVHFVIENSNTIKFKMVEVASEKNEDHQLLCPFVQTIIQDIPLMQQDLLILSTKSIELSNIAVQNKPLNTESNCLLLVVSDLLETVEMSVVLNAVKDAKGFVISRENLNVDLTKFNQTPLEVLCSYKTNQETLVLLRQIKKSLNETRIVDITNASDTLEWVPKLQEVMKENNKVVVYAQGDELSGILGLVNCLKREPNGSNVYGVFIMDDAPPFDPSLDFYRKQLDKNLLINIWKDGCWGTYRHFLLAENQLIHTEHCYVNVTTKGDLSTLRWLEGNLNTDDPTACETELIHIYYSALNFRDLMTASGKVAPEHVTRDRIKQECIQGFEFSGRDTRGKRIMGMCDTGSLATLTQCDKFFVYDILDEWTLEEAATIPVAYITVMQVLVMNNQLKPGQTILIHSGTGGVGLAAINLCLHYQLTIFVTVGTQEKREFIRKHYPQIKEEHIGNSRDCSFELMIQKHTNRRGVDYVLNSLAEEKLLASVRCLAKGGKFLEIGKFDLANNTALTLALLQKDAHFTGIAVDKHLALASSDEKQAYRDQFLALLKSGAVKPLPRIIFAEDEVENAFRYMGQGKHIGKILIKIREEENCAIYNVPRVLFRGHPRFHCKPQCSYVILGGLGGFGLELADFLVVRGAQKLVLTSKSGLSNGYQHYRIRSWKEYGVTTLTSNCDTSTQAGCEEILKIANELGPVDAIFNLAAVLKDAVFENQTIEDFKTVLSPKAYGAKYLDSISRKLCPNLRYFVVFSSVSCGRGNVGQTNYGMANSIMERICEKRKREGYPGLAIQWGAIGEVGLVAKMQEDHRELVIGGTLQQRISNCLQMLDKLLKQEEPVVGSMLVAEKKYGGKANNLFDAILNIMGVTNLKAISMHSTFPELGMDSMMAVEIKQTLEREYEVFLTAQDIRSMTLSKLKDLSNAQEEHATVTQITQADLPIDIKLLLHFIGNEEDSNVPIVKLKTLVEDNEEAPHVLALPGLEGMAVILEPICKKLKAHVSCLQFCAESKAETILDLATSLLPYIDSFKGDLIILAYSFGCVVATELLRLLELKGKKATVIYIDGSPILFTKLVRYSFPSNDENTVQTILITHLMMRYMSYEYVISHEEKLRECKSYEEKIDYLISVSPKVDVPTKYIKEMCISSLKRLLAIYEYTPKMEKLKCPITLFKSAQTSSTVEFDYGLSDLFENIVNVLSIEGDHITMLDNDYLSSEINRIISQTNNQREATG